MTMGDQPGSAETVLPCGCRLHDAEPFPRVVWEEDCPTHGKAGNPFWPSDPGTVKALIDQKAYVEGCLEESRRQVARLQEENAAIRKLAELSGEEEMRLRRVLAEERALTDELYEALQPDKDVKAWIARAVKANERWRANRSAHQEPSPGQ